MIGIHPEWCVASGDVEASTTMRPGQRLEERAASPEATTGRGGAKDGQQRKKSKSPGETWARRFRWVFFCAATALYAYYTFRVWHPCPKATVFDCNGLPVVATTQENAYVQYQAWVANTFNMTSFQSDLLTWQTQPGKEYKFADEFPYMCANGMNYLKDIRLVNGNLQYEWEHWEIMH